MNTISLAARYLTIRKSRAFLLFIVFFAINIMAFTVVSIRQAAVDALSKLEGKTLNYFYIDSTYEMDPESVIVEGSNISFLSRPHLITDEIIEKVMGVDGIQTYAAHYAFLSGEVADAAGNPLQLVAYRIPADGNDAASIRGITDSDLYSGTTIKLAAGEHITPDTERAAMVNKQFAVLNGLKEGDKLLITMPGNTSGIEVNVLGIYEMPETADESELSPTELSANFIYVDYDTALALDNGKQGIISAEFFVDQPDQLTAIFTEVQNLDIDWNKYFLFNEADAAVIDVDSVKAVSRQFTVLTTVIIIAGFLISALVMMLQTKMRANEIAIFLSLGFTQSKILLQHIIEAMIPAGISLVAAYFTGDYLISSQLFHAFNISVNGIQTVTIVEIVILNLCLLIAAIWISAIRLLYAPPKKIFSKIN